MLKYLGKDEKRIFAGDVQPGDRVVGHGEAIRIATKGVRVVIGFADGTSRDFHELSLVDIRMGATK